MIKTLNKIVLFLLLSGIMVVIGCNRNYYSGTGKGGGNCGCPSHKGMSGY